MALTVGARLGVYEVTSSIGEGGMGQVWLAIDTSLGRSVAIKILPDAFASDPERLARLEREARTLAALNHPHIASIYGFERSSGTHALVMEFVDGEDLAQRLKRGAIPIDEALPIARQVAEALEAAHEQGIIHRDLKPANIKVRDDGTVKVLDFGLAKSIEPEAGSREPGAAANSPTITTPAMTMRGVILGTAVYMAPEQAKGRPIDRRADIWAFGCVLFELLTGTRAFDGEDTTEILGAIVKTEPEWSRLPAVTPPQIVALLRRCLQKDPKKRQQHIGDARIEIGEAITAPIEPAQPARAAWRPWAVAALMAIVATIAFVIAIRRPAAVDPRPDMLLQYDVPMSMIRNQATLSPDGRYLAYLARGTGGRDDLWLRDLRKPAGDKLGSVTGGDMLIWAPDSASLSVLELPKTIRRFDMRTRSSVSQSVTSPIGPQLMVGPGAGGFVMVADRRIIVGAGPFSNFATLQVWTPEGTAPLLPLDTAQNEVRQSSPARFGPNRISYASVRADGTTHLCVTALVDPKPVCAGTMGQTSRVFYQDGHVVFSRGGSLLARGFDLDRVAFTGEEQAIVDGLVSPLNTSQRFDLSDSGVLAFPVGEGSESLVWQAAAGQQVVLANRSPSTNMTLSPDGRRVLTTSQGNELYQIDLTTGGSARLGATAGDPVWAPDGRRFVHRTTAGIVVRSVDDARESVLLPGNATAFPEDWSRDGRWIVVGMRTGATQVELLPANGGERVPILSREDSISNADEMHFSPDGRWLAFNALSGARQEVFVMPLPPTGQRWQVSSAGGMQARWHPNGRTLYFLDGEGMMMAAEIAAGQTFSAGVPRALFDVGFSPAPINDDYRVAPDGRFLVKTPGAENAIRIIVNWSALLTAQNTP